jgi:hypothetical protein
MKLSALKAMERTISVEFKGTTTEVTYKMGALLLETPSKLFDYLAAVVARWDLEGDDGQPVPLTPEALAGVPLPFLRAVEDTISRDARPGNRSGTL